MLLQNGRALTDKGDDRDFLTELVLKTSSEPIAIATGIRRPSDTREHVTGSHDKGRDDGDDGPYPTTLENGRDETKHQDTTENTGSGGDPTSPIYGISVWNRNGGVLREVGGEWPSVESTALVINGC